MRETIAKAVGSRGFSLAFSLTVLACAASLALPAPAFIYVGYMVPDTTVRIDYKLTHLALREHIPLPRYDDFWRFYVARQERVTDLVRGVWEAAILPIGCGMLSFVFTVQLIKVSQRMDGNASMPGVKEVVFMLVFFAVFLFLIQNSFDLMQAVYQVVQLAIDRVTGLFGTGSELDLEAVSITTTDDDVAALVAMLVVALVSWLVVIVAYVVALVVSWARAIQIYVMAAFSPIPLALVSLDETRQMGVGYLKNFAAVCLAGIIILVLLVSFPIVLGGLNAASVGAPVVDSIVGGLSYALQYLAMCVLLILSLVKSGAWARDILGG